MRICNNGSNIAVSGSQRRAREAVMSLLADEVPMRQQINRKAFLCKSRSCDR